MDDFNFPFYDYAHFKNSYIMKMIDFVLIFK